MANCPSLPFACPAPVSFGYHPDNPVRMTWSQNADVQGCLEGTAKNFSYGIYSWAVPLVTDGRFVQKILYPLFRGIMTFRCYSVTNFNSCVFLVFHVIQKLLFYLFVYKNFNRRREYQGIERNCKGEVAMTLDCSVFSKKLQIQKSNLKLLSYHENSNHWILVI